MFMFVKKKKNRSGTTSVVVAEKKSGVYDELVTIGIAREPSEIDSLVNAGKEWISKEKARRHPRLDLFGEEREACDREREEVRRVLSQVENVLLNGCDLILDRTFDRVGFNRIDDEVFRKLVNARLACPASKAATVEYLKNHFDDDVDLSKIYRYLDKLSGRQRELVQNISVRHPRPGCSAEASGCCSMTSPRFTSRPTTRTNCARRASRKRGATAIRKSSWASW